jgi:hypothetical protein
VFVNGAGSFTMSAAAAVDTGNTVYLEDRPYDEPPVRSVITLSGTLSASIAANIEDAGSSPGTRVLGGDIADNYGKFLLNGAAGRIDAAGQIKEPGP